MEDDGRGGAAGEAKAAPPSYEVDTHDPRKNIRLLESIYRDRGPRQSQRPIYSLYYKDRLTETEKDEFLKVRASELAFFWGRFCSMRDPYRSRALLSDAVMFFKLHKTWQAYICPTCEFLFLDGDSLVLHLMYEHSNALPFLRQNPAEEQWCTEALHSTVWKPIDVSVALNRLYTYGCLDTVLLRHLEWPLSEDFRRSKLLGKLQAGFEELLDSQERASSIVRSGGCLRALVAMASEHILRHLDPMNNLPLPIRALFYCSPLSFRFMEEASLGHFVSLVEVICSSTRASQNRQLQGSKSRCECLDAVSLSADCNYFVLDAAKLGEKDVGLWLFDAPYFPGINNSEIFQLAEEKAVYKASEILRLAEEKAASFSECLRTVHAQSDLKLLTSCLKILNMGHWPMPFIDASSPEVASNSEFDVANVEGMLGPSSYYFREPAKRQRTEFDSRHYLKLIELTRELQSFELQVRRLCAVDLRDNILPLLRSFLRMKLYFYIRTGYKCLPGDSEEEDAPEVIITEGSREEHPEEHVHSNFEGEPATEDDSDLTMPDMSSYKTSEELSTAAVELGCSGSSAINLSDLDLMMIEGEAPEGKPSGASAGCTDTSITLVASSDAALSRSRTGIAAVLDGPKGKAESIPESDAEPESQRSQELQDPLSFDFDRYFDFDSLSESKGAFKNFGGKEEFVGNMEFAGNKGFSVVLRLMREKSAWENKDGLFICMTINDVVKHCIGEFGLRTAQNIWGWKTNSARKYWRCFQCNKRFPDQESHILHLESDHDLGIPWVHEWLVPSQVQQESQSGLSDCVEERIHSLDDSIIVDCTYRRYIVAMEKFGSLYQKGEEGNVQKINEYWQIVRQIELQICCLVGMLHCKFRRCLTFEIGELDAEIVEKYAELKMSKQNLSNLCISDYKNEIFPSICSFMQERMDSGFKSWALGRLNELLHDVRYPCCFLVDSLSIRLVSSGKVIINIEENNAGITFAHVGILFKFIGDVPHATGDVKESKKIRGIFMFSEMTDSVDSSPFDSCVFLDTKEIETTEETYWFRQDVRMSLTVDLQDKLCKFQAECRGKLQG